MKRRQQGGAISLLLTLVVIGLLAYFALRGSAGSPAAPGAPGAPIDCERRIGTLIQQTGGLGPDYKTGYDALPPACQKLVPAPGALAPSTERAPDT